LVYVAEPATVIAKLRELRHKTVLTRRCSTTRSNTATTGDAEPGLFTEKVMPEFRPPTRQTGRGLRPAPTGAVALHNRAGGWSGSLVFLVRVALRAFEA
jgi:hypothetical protein